MSDEQPPEPTRRKFTQDVVDRFTKAIDEITLAVPELRGAAIALIWDDDMPMAELPFGLVQGRDSGEPFFTLRSVEQSTKVLRYLTQQYVQQYRQGVEALSTLNGQIQTKRDELESLQTEGQNSPRREETTGPRDTDDPGTN
jgi:hypothetical protein